MADTHQPSFMKSLFQGKIEEDLLFPYPALDGEEADNLELLIDTLHKFAADNIDSKAIDENSEIPMEVLNGLGELGLWGLIIPEKYDGYGFSQTAYSKVFEEIARIDSSIVVTLGAHSSIGLKGLLLFGSDELKQKYLPGLATGEQLAAFALTEPGSGSDAASIATRAELSDDGKYYILNGTKIWITNGGIADVFTVFAQTEMEIDGEKKDKITAFIVTRDMEGFSSGGEEKKLGIKGSSTTELHFDNVKVPVENMLGPRGKGFKVAMMVLNSGRLGLASGCVGAMKDLVGMSTEHALQREQFQTKIAEFEIIKEKIARMNMNAYVTESMVYHTTGLADMEEVDYSLESAICKVYASEKLWDVVNEALQISAGAGYMKEYPYERFLRDSRINMIFEGTNEILRVFVALMGMEAPGDYLKKVGKALRDPIKSAGLLTDYVYKKIRRSVTHQELPKAHEALKPSVEAFTKYVDELAGTVEKVLTTHGKKIIHREHIQKRIAEAAMELYAMGTTISRTTADIEADGLESSQVGIDICNTFCEESWRRIRRRLTMTESNQDETINAMAEAIYARRGYVS
ncbi:MAG: acyl-CoA dehydrogenase family protein [Candidatus Marinimicrobia bacterium]|nr:acyl-CoA dehydrogenase family protein [Candidatus Neomarinimicrobiota bacterium]MCF7828009.1 acyl-CoA dehydrogenase family protein [Candidatus Neomarinimicrobiota bacterium]MCF7879236.1 acyl-CoA dehydrogenase family protein [Candidatus Neomarinimicrobiota bacterium]